MRNIDRIERAIKKASRSLDKIGKSSSKLSRALRLAASQRKSDDGEGA